MSENAMKPPQRLEAHVAAAHLDPGLYLVATPIGTVP